MMISITTALRKDFVLLDKHWEKTIEWQFAVKVSQAKEATFAPLDAAPEADLADAFGKIDGNYGIIEFKKDLAKPGIDREIKKFDIQPHESFKEAKAELYNKVTGHETAPLLRNDHWLFEAKLPHLLISSRGIGDKLELVQSDFFNVLINRTQGFSNEELPLCDNFHLGRIQSAFVEWETFCAYLVELFKLKKTTTVSGVSGVVGISHDGNLSVLPLSSLSQHPDLAPIFEPCPPSEGPGYNSGM